MAALANGATISFQGGRNWLFTPDRKERMAYKAEQDAKYEKKDYKKLGPVTSTANEAVMKSLARWPHVQTIVAQAPMVMATSHIFRGAVKQSSKLIDLLHQPETALFLLKYLPDYLDRARLSVSCTAAYAATDRFTEHWDLTTGNVLGADKAAREPRRMRDDSSGYASQPAVTNLKITPFQHQDVERYKGKIWRKLPSANESLRHLYTVLTGLQNSAPFIQSLQLHRLPFLSTNMVEMIANSLPSLEYLGVFQCRLIHLGEMIYLVDIVGKKKLLGEGDLVFDCYPNYHRGPIVTDPFEGRSVKVPASQAHGPNDPWGYTDGQPEPEDDWENCHRLSRFWSSGISWGKTPFRSYLGVYAIFMYHVWPRLRRYDMTDILGRGKAFRLFMERLPVPKYSFVRIVEALMTRDTPGLVDQATRHRAFARDVLGAIGENKIPITLFDLLAEQRACRRCKTKMLTVFFPKRTSVCLGCDLRRFIGLERDHYKTARNLIAGDIMRYAGLPPPEEEDGDEEPDPEEELKMHPTLVSLVEALRAGPGHSLYAVLYNADMRAALLDGTREHHMAPGYTHWGAQVCGDEDCHSLFMRMNRTHHPIGPEDRLRADVQLFTPGQHAWDTATAWMTDYTTDQDACEQLEGMAAFEGLSRRAKVKCVAELRDQMRVRDQTEIRNALTEESLFRAELVDLPSDDWDEIHSSYTVDNFYRYGRTDRIEHVGSDYDVSLIQNGASLW